MSDRVVNDDFMTLVSSELLSPEFSIHYAKISYKTASFVKRAAHNTVHHLHHRKLRSQGGDNSPEKVVLLCFACYDWVHRNPDLARGRGFIVRSVGEPSLVPVRYRNGGFVRLLDVDPELY